MQCEFSMRITKRKEQGILEFGECACTKVGSERHDDIVDEAAKEEIEEAAKLEALLINVLAIETRATRHKGRALHIKRVN